MRAIESGNRAAKASVSAWRFILVLFLLTLTVVSLPLHADEPENRQWSSGKQQTTLVELFTSQGCSSCPPAERWLGRLKQHPKLWKEIVPVAFHVDYWNDLGWEDPFSSKAFSYRQYRYKKEGSVKIVYTPGFVVNGKEWRGWFDHAPLPATSQHPGQLMVKLIREHLEVNFQPEQAYQEERLVLNLALLGTEIETEVLSGENAGKRLPQDFTVLTLIPRIPTVDNQWLLKIPDLERPSGSRLAFAAWVSPPFSNRPIQAVGGWLEEWAD